MNWTPIFDIRELFEKLEEKIQSGFVKVCFSRLVKVRLGDVPESGKVLVICKHCELKDIAVMAVSFRHAIRSRVFARGSSHYRNYYSLYSLDEILNLTSSRIRDFRGHSRR